jgi:hypothetical protein
MEEIENYKFGKPYKDKIPVEEADKFATIFGEGSPALTELIKYCIENEIVTYASCKGHPENRDVILRLVETGYITFSFDRDYDEEDFAYFLASIPSSEKGITATIESSIYTGRTITFYVPAHVKDESEIYFASILDKLKKYKQMKEENISFDVNPEIKEIVDYTFNPYNAFEVFDITHTSYKKYERSGGELRRVAKCPASDKTKVLHGEFGNYLKGLREKRVNEFITHKR